MIWNCNHFKFKFKLCRRNINGIYSFSFVCWMIFFPLHFQIKSRKWCCALGWRARLIKLRIWIVFNEHEVLGFTSTKLQLYLPTYLNMHLEMKLTFMTFTRIRVFLQKKKEISSNTHFLLPSIAIII